MKTVGCLAARSCIGRAAPALAEGPSGKFRSVAEHEFAVAAPVIKVFPLFDPVNEPKWEPSFKPMAVYPEEISAQENAIFLTGNQGSTVVWNIITYLPAEYRIEYLVTDPGHSQRRITVQCEPGGAGETRVRVRYINTALSEEGCAALRRYSVDFLRAWEQPVRNAAEAPTTGESKS